MMDDLAHRRHQLSEIERRIREHPACKAYMECLALEMTITAVFVPNLRELLALLDRAATDPALAAELVQNVHAPTVREAFHAEVAQRLHNHLASTASLGDHAMRIMRDRLGALADEYAERKAGSLQRPEVQFVRQLRNYTLHRVLPFLGHTLKIDSVNPNPSMTSEVQLNTSELLEWDKWPAKCRAFIKEQGDALLLRPVVRVQGELVATLNIWLHTELVNENGPPLDELNAVVAERNALLAGVDFETAQRLTEEWTRRRSMPPQPWPV